jgi:hypothetical protein
MPNSLLAPSPLLKDEPASGLDVRGFQSRAGYPSKRAGSRCRYVLRTRPKVKVAGNWQGRQGSNLRQPVLETGRGRVVWLSRVFINLVLLRVKRSIGLSRNVWLWHVCLSLGPVLGPPLPASPGVRAMSAISPEDLYRRIGRLIEECPP